MHFSPTDKRQQPSSGQKACKEEGRGGGTQSSETEVGVLGGTSATEYQRRKRKIKDSFWS